MAWDGFMGDILCTFACLRQCTSAFDPTSGSGDHLDMDDFLKKNLAYLSARQGQTAIGKTVNSSQSKISRITTGVTKKVDWRIVKELSTQFGVTMDDLTGRDLEMEGPSASSQDSGLDLDMLGTALTGVEKSIKDKVISGQLGTLAQSVAFAYELAADFPRKMTPKLRIHYDKLLHDHFKGLSDGQKRANGEIAEGSKGRNRQADAKSKKARAGGR